MSESNYAMEMAIVSLAEAAIELTKELRRYNDAAEREQIKEKEYLKLLEETCW